MINVVIPATELIESGSTQIVDAGAYRKAKEGEKNENAGKVTDTPPAEYVYENTDNTNTFVLLCILGFVCYRKFLK